MEMKALVEEVVRALVDSPEEVDVSEIHGTSMKLLEIRVSPRDVGKLIGKEGKTITALRTIVTAAGKGKQYTVNVIEEKDSEQRRTFRGRIKRLFEDRNYGFIEADDGRNIFFHESSLKGMGIRSLAIDQAVEFKVERGPDGFKAVGVIPLGRAR